MIVQDEVFLIALSGMGLVTVAFIHVIMNAGKSADEAEAKHAYKTSNVLRRWLFWALVVVYVGASYATLHKFPIPPQHGPLPATQIVTVVGHQWMWQLSTTKIEAGVPVEFQVTSADVNHDFAIYGPDGRIVVQAQAMPGYTNKILHTFDTPGTYEIKCLEYCGIGHDVMAAKVTVVAATTGGPTS